MLRLGRDYWFLRSAYNWNHFCSSLVRPPVYSDWMENWKLEKVMTRDRRRTRCTKYFQICWDATELQRAASSTPQKKNNQSARKTVNLAKVRFAEKVKVNKNESWSGEMCPWSFKSIQRSATKSSHFLSAFCPLFAIWTQPHLLILSYPELDVNFLRLRTISRNPEDYQRLNKNLLKKNSQNHSGCLKIS